MLQSIWTLQFCAVSVNWRVGDVEKRSEIAIFRATADFARLETIEHNITP